MKKLIFLILICFATKLAAQTYTDVFSNDKFKVREYTGKKPYINSIKNIDDDTIWISYAEYDTSATYRVISLDDNLNIISNDSINYSNSYTNIITHKLNNKFYGIHYLNSQLDTIQFRCFDENGNNLIDKSLWIKNNIDTLWVYGSHDNEFQFRMLSNNNFLLVANARYPSNADPYGSDAIRFILFDTLGNILNTKDYPFKSMITEFQICEVGEHLIIDKIPFTNPLPTGAFSYPGTSYINKTTLEVEDSIPRMMGFLDSINGVIYQSLHTYRFIEINDSTFAGLFYIGCAIVPQHQSNLKLHIFNKNTKEIIHTIVLKPDEEINVENNYDRVSDRFVYNNTDSIYTHYKKNGNSLEIVNFNPNGNVNFTYNISFPTNYWNEWLIGGMKLTKEGELILIAYGIKLSPPERVSWIIKFNHNGLMSLTNIETGEKESVRVYPNPAKDYINIDIDANAIEKSEIELYDIQGRLVRKESLNKLKENRINTSSLKAGAYTYNLFFNGKSIRGKVIIEK